MKSSKILRALAAAALLTLAASSAGAQTATTSSAASAAWAAMPVGTYELNIQLPDQLMPATVKITDSSGTPAATFKPEGDQDAHPVKATIKGTELYLNGEAPKGPFEIVLLRQGEELTGRWKYAGDEGKLTGKVAH